MGRPVKREASPVEYGVSRRDLLRTLSGLGVTAVATNGQVGTVRGEPGDRAWVAETPTDVESSPTVVDGTVFVGTNGGNVYALDASDGANRWQFETGATVGSSPTVVDGTVYVGSDDGGIYALDAAGGSQRWRFETGSPVRSSPTVANGRLFVGNGRRNRFFNTPDSRQIYALDATDGTEQWRVEVGNSVRTGPTVVDGTVYVACDDFTVYALDAASGSQRWSADTNGKMPSSPTVAGGTVFVGSEDASLHALDAGTGRELWRRSLGGWVESSPTVVDDTVFVGSNGGGVYALDAEDGSQQWRFGTGSVVSSSPTVADGTVVVGASNGTIYALAADSGDERWRSETGGTAASSPTVAGGTVYAGSDGVYALESGLDGRSIDSRVRLGTLGHHGAWTGQAAALSPASFAVEIAETNSPVPAGESVTVTIAVTNTGDWSTTGEIDVTAEGLGTESLTVSVPSGSATQRTVTLGTDSKTPGEYTVRATSETGTDTASIVVPDATATPTETATETPTPTVTPDAETPTATPVPDTETPTATPTQEEAPISPSTLLMGGGGLLTLLGVYALVRLRGDHEPAAASTTGGDDSTGEGTTTTVEDEIGEKLTAARDLLEEAEQARDAGNYDRAQTASGEAIGRARDAYDRASEEAPYLVTDTEACLEDAQAVRETIQNQRNISEWIDSEHDRIAEDLDTVEDHLDEGATAEATELLGNISDRLDDVAAEIESAEPTFQSKANLQEQLRGIYEASRDRAAEDS